MSAPKATPGPWWVGDARNGWAIVTDDGARIVASVMRAYPPDSGEDEQRKADADLIAATPGLVDALEALLPVAVEWGSRNAKHPALDAARAALRKAGR